MCWIWSETYQKSLGLKNYPLITISLFFFNELSWQANFKKNPATMFKAYHCMFASLIEKSA